MRILDWLGRLGGVRLAILTLVVLHLVLLATAMTLGRIWPREPFAGTWDALVLTGPGSQLISFWQRWDALWYQHIAETGYQAGNGTTAFFPLYPLLVRFVSVVAFGNTVVAGLLVSGAATVAALSSFWALIRLEATRAGWGASPVLSATGVLLIASFPTAFFLLAPFTESLFLALTIGTLYAARSGRPWLAGGLGLLAGLTRPQGIFLALPIAWEVLRQGGALDWLARTGGRRPGRDLLAAVLPVAGMAGLTAYQRIVTGETKAGLDAQAPWGFILTWPGIVLQSSWTYITASRTVTERVIEGLNAASLLGGAAIVAVAVRRIPFAYTLYALPSLALLAFRQMGFSPLMSVSRYVLVVFPLFLAVTPWVARRPRLALAVIVAGVIADAALFQYFVRWGFVA